MKGKIAVSVVAVFFALEACNSPVSEKTAGKKDCISGCLEKGSALHQLTGSWKWVETDYYSEQFGRIVKTPQNTGKELTYTFTDDTLIISSDGKVIERARFEIGTLKDLTHYPQDTILIMRLFNAEDNHKISLLHFCGENVILVNSYNNLGGNVKLQKT